jgi:hypothetical protein
VLHKAGGIHLSNLHDLKTGKDLKRPAARLTGSVCPALSRLFISLEKMGVPDAWRTNLIFLQKPNRTLLVMTIKKQGEFQLFSFNNL